MRNAAAWCAPFAFAPGLVMRSRGLGNGGRILSAFPELTGNRFCTKKAISLAPAGGLSVFCLHSGAVFKIVFRGRKICALYFKICLTYFEICRTYFLFAPTWGLSTENQFSIFHAPKQAFPPSFFANPPCSRAFARSIAIPLQFRCIYFCLILIHNSQLN